MDALTPSMNDGDLLTGTAMIPSTFRDTKELMAALSFSSVSIESDRRILYPHRFSLVMILPERLAKNGLSMDGMVSPTVLVRLVLRPCAIRSGVYPHAWISSCIFDMAASLIL